VLHFAFPSSELRVWRNMPARLNDLTWLPAPPDESSVIVSCLFGGQTMTDDMWPGRNRGTRFLGSKLLPNGEKFWLVWKQSPTSPVEKAVLSVLHTQVTRQDSVPFKNPIPGSKAGARITGFSKDPDSETLVVVDAAADEPEPVP
jgi:hypothetical protein